MTYGRILVDLVDGEEIKYTVRYRLVKDPGDIGGGGGPSFEFSDVELGFDGGNLIGNKGIDIDARNVRTGEALDSLLVDIDLYVSEGGLIRGQPRVGAYHLVGWRREGY